MGASLQLDMWDVEPAHNWPEREREKVLVVSPTTPMARLWQPTETGHGNQIICTATWHWTGFGILVW